MNCVGSSVDTAFRSIYVFSLRINFNSILKCFHLDKWNLACSEWLALAVEFKGQVPRNICRKFKEIRSIFLIPWVCDKEKAKAKMNIECLSIC